MESERRGRRKSRIAVWIAVVFILIAGGMRANEERTMKPSQPGADASSFGSFGPHAVGTRTDRAADGRLPVRVWYPADADPAAGHAMTYPHELKWFMRVGFVARVRGHGIRDAPFAHAAGAAPVVVLSPGFSIGITAYTWLAERLASHGFVVVAPEHRELMSFDMGGFWKGLIRRPPDVRHAIDWVEREGAAGGTLAGRVDAERVAVVGHSLGGYTALAVAGARLDLGAAGELCDAAVRAGADYAWLCDMVLPHAEAMAELAGLGAAPEGPWPGWRDDRVAAVVTMAGDAYPFGGAGLAHVHVPTLAIGGTADSATPWAWGTGLAYDHVASPRRVRVGLDGAEHMVFLEGCDAMPFFRRIGYRAYCSDEVWETGLAHDAIVHFVTAFLRAELMVDGDAAAELHPARVSLPGITYAADGY